MWPRRSKKLTQSTFGRLKKLIQLKQYLLQQVFKTWQNQFHFYREINVVQTYGSKSRGCVKLRFLDTLQSTPTGYPTLKRLNSEDFPWKSKFFSVWKRNFFGCYAESSQKYEQRLSNLSHTLCDLLYFITSLKMSHKSGLFMKYIQIFCFWFLINFSIFQFFLISRFFPIFIFVWLLVFPIFPFFIGFWFYSFIFWVLWFFTFFWNFFNFQFFMIF